MSKLVVMDHPLIQHKVSLMRSKDTSTKAFRELLDEVSMLMAYEVTRDLPLEDIEVETPICKCTAKEIAGKKLAVVPILRAGLGMVDGVTRLVPSARVGHIGLYRDPNTLEPVEYYCKLPKDIEERDIILVDPMLATGGSMELSYKALLTKGTPKDIHIASVIASRQAIDYVKDHFPENTTIWVGAIDDKLDEHSYIVPGLGDAGDLAYGIKE